MASKDLAANAAGAATSTSDLEMTRLIAILATAGGNAILDLAPLEEARFSNLPNATAGGAATISAALLAAKLLAGSSAGDADANLTTILSTAIMEAEMGGQANANLDMLIGHLLPNAEAFGFADSTYAKLITLVSMGDDPNSLPKSTGKAVVSDATAVMQRGLISTIAGIAGTDTTSLGGKYGLPSANAAGATTPYASLVKGGTLLSQDIYLEVTGSPTFNGDADPGAEKFGTWKVPVTLRRGGTTSTRIPAGTALVNWGKNDPLAQSDAYTGGIILTSDMTHAPYIDIFTVDKHNMDGYKPWQDQAVKPRVRLGNLNGVAGNTWDKWGIVMSTDLSNAGNPLIQSSNEGLVIQDADVSIMNGSFYVGSSDGTSSYIQWDKNTQQLTIKNDLGNTTINGNQITTGSITLDKIVFGTNLGYTTEALLYLNFDGPPSSSSVPLQNQTSVQGSVYSHTGQGPYENQNTYFIPGKFGTAAAAISGAATNYGGGDFTSYVGYNMVSGTRAYQGWSYDPFVTHYTFSPPSGGGQIAVVKASPITVPSGYYVFYGGQIGLYNLDGPYPMIGLATGDFLDGSGQPDGLVSVKTTYQPVDSSDVNKYRRFGTSWYNDTGMDQDLYMWVWTDYTTNNISLYGAEFRMGSTEQYPTMGNGSGSNLTYGGGWSMEGRYATSCDGKKGSIIFWVGLPIGGDAGSVLDPAKQYPMLGGNTAHTPCLWLENVSGEWRLYIDREASWAWDDNLCPDAYAVWDEYAYSGRADRQYAYDQTMIEFYWAHVCITYEQYNQICFYINGVLQKTVTGDYDLITKAFSDSSFVFMMGRDSSNHYLCGYLDEFTILDHPLPAEDVAFIYNSGKPLNVVMSGDYKFSLMGGAGGGFILASSSGIVGYSDAGFKQAVFSDSGKITDANGGVRIDAHGLTVTGTGGSPPVVQDANTKDYLWLKAGGLWMTSYFQIANGAPLINKIAANYPLNGSGAIAWSGILSIENWVYSSPNYRTYLNSGVVLDLAGNTYLTRGGKWDDLLQNWIRTLPQNQANRFGLESTGDVSYYSQTDSGNTVDSAITWGKKWSLTPNGSMHVYGDLTVDGKINTVPSGAGWTYGQWTNATFWSGQNHTSTAKTKINLSADFGIPAGVKEVYLYIAMKDTASATGESWTCFWNDATANKGVFVDCSGNANGLYDRNQIIVPCDADGNIYYQVSTVGTQSLWVVVLGYRTDNAVTTTNPGNAGWSYLNSPLTNSFWNGGAYSTVSTLTAINANTAFGVPQGAKAILVKIYARDSASSTSSSTCRFCLSPMGVQNNNEEVIVYLDGEKNDTPKCDTGIITLDSSGNFGYKTQATGTGTLDCWIQIWGYCMGNITGIGEGWVFTDATNAATWYGKVISTVATKTAINLISEFNLPVGTTAVLARVATKDTASAGSTNYNFSFWKTANSANTVAVSRTAGAVAGYLVEDLMVLPVDDSGNIYYTSSASGTSTMTVYLICAGYLLPTAIERANSATLQGYAPATNGNNAHVMVTTSTGAFNGGYGTSNPASGANGDRFFRTDLGLEVIFWNGSWYTVDTFTAQLPSTTATGTAVLPSQFALHGDYGVAVMRTVTLYRVNTTANASNYWSVAIRAVNLAYNGSTNVASFNTTAAVAGTQYMYETQTAMPGLAVAQSLSYRFDWSLTKTGTPGNLDIVCTVYYKLIIT